MATYDEAIIQYEVRVIGTLALGLYGFLLGLPDRDLGRQSACDAWTVRDVAGHLTNRAERQIASMTRGRTGDSGASRRIQRAVGQYGDVGGQRGCGHRLYAVDG